MKVVRTRPASGFTIVELMIATLVFSVVLILITVGVLTFTKSYYKGINQSNTQNTARVILEDISQAIQFSGDAVTTDLGDNNGSQGFCIGNRRYSYLPGKQLWDDGAPDNALNQARHALVLDQNGNCGGMDPQDVAALPAGLAAGNTELLQPRMRISRLAVQREGATDLYRVSIRIVYGDDDLLENPTAANARCKVSISGSQYCAEAELSTTVKKRINQN